MTEVFVSLGSNINKEYHIKAALTAFAEHFTHIVTSPVYETPALGFDGPAFYNLVVKFNSELDLYTLIDLLKDIEQHCGQTTQRESFQSRGLDIDLLLFGNTIEFSRNVELPSSDIVKYPFVLKPLAELCGNHEHPVLKLRYNFLWENFCKNTLPMQPITLDITG